MKTFIVLHNSPDLGWEHKLVNVSHAKLCIASGFLLGCVKKINCRKAHNDFVDSRTERDFSREELEQTCGLVSVNTQRTGLQTPGTSIARYKTPAE